MLYTFRAYLTCCHHLFPSTGIALLVIALAGGPGFGQNPRNATDEQKNKSRNGRERTGTHKTSEKTADARDRGQPNEGDQDSTKTEKQLREELVQAKREAALSNRRVELIEEKLRLLAQIAEHKAQATRGTREPSLEELQKTVETLRRQLKTLQQKLEDAQAEERQPQNRSASGRTRPDTRSEPRQIPEDNSPGVRKNYRGFRQPFDRNFSPWGPRDRSPEIAPPPREVKEKK